MTDRLAEATSDLVALTGNTPKPVKPRPRPVTAIDRVERRLRQERHERLTAFVLGEPSAQGLID